MKKKVVIGLSGGVDSAVAAALLKKKGFEVFGVSLKLPVFKGKRSFLSAKKICQKLKISHYIVDVQKEFKKTVVNYFINSYKEGQTPNPCMICNPQLKFKTLFDFAKKMGIKYVATGHYCQVIRSQGNKVISYQLQKAKDKIKDQSYYLSMLPQKWLANLVFPLSKITKQQVIKLAKKFNLDKIIETKSSQDFCYLAHSSTKEFLQQKIAQKEGQIIDPHGKVLGKHFGLHFYTLGQRKGIYLSQGPWYVKSFIWNKNQLIVTKNKKDLEKNTIFISPYNFISIPIPRKKLEVMVKVRYRQNPAQATLFPPSKMKLKLVFKKPQTAITPGQFAVFYQKRAILGGGIINKS